MFNDMMSKNCTFTNLRYRTAFFFLIVSNFPDIRRVRLRVVLHNIDVVLTSNFRLLSFLSHFHLCKLTTSRSSRNTRHCDLHGRNPRRAICLLKKHNPGVYTIIAAILAIYTKKKEKNITSNI